MTKRMNTILVGAPGSGKGTQAKRIEASFALPQISTGDMLRAARRAGTELGKQAAEFMDAGKLVPDSLIVGLIDERLKEKDTEGGFVLDGFPRTLAQAEALKATLDKAGLEITHVVVIDVPAEDIVGRITGRRSCKNCGAVFHVSFSPPKVDGVCDSCGKSELYQRSDDTEEKVRVRLDAYEAQTGEVIPFYEKLGVVTRIDGSRAPDIVFENIKEVLSEV